MSKRTEINHPFAIFKDSYLLDITGRNNGKIFIGVNPDIGINWNNSEYFMVFNHTSFLKADKMAKIKFRCPEYVNYKDSKKDWTLSLSERKKLVEFLASKSDNFPGYTFWQECIMYFKKGGYNIPYPKSQLLHTSEIANPQSPYHRTLPIDLSIPDYVNGIL